MQFLSLSEQLTRISQCLLDLVLDLDLGTVGTGDWGLGLGLDKNLIVDNISMYISSNLTFGILSKPNTLINMLY